MKKICETAIRLLESGQGFAQATILASSGSTPRGAGSCMIIEKNGAICDTVGGGVLEAGIISLAPEVYASCLPRVISVTLDGTDAAALGAICGGSATVLIDYIAPDAQGALDFYKTLLTALRSGGRVKLVTAVPGSDTPTGRRQCLLLGGNTLAGETGFDPGVLALLGNNPGGYDVFTRLENRQVYLSPVGTDGTAYIFGAGHCGQKLAHVLATVGFGTVIIDDRAEFANAARFPDADEILVPPEMDAPLNEPGFAADSYIVIVTRGHVHDELVLRAALRTSAGYIGMIGSKRKRETIYRHLLADGYKQADIDRVYSPIGIDIGADTPEEIAVSITAELIKIRAARRNHSRGD